ncbi:MAG: MBL fold metallo-hydrolase [Acidobacteriota bacterium]
MTVSVFVLGVGDAFSERYNSSSFVVSAGDFHLMIDCPERVRKTIREARERAHRHLEIAMLNHVLITHLHGDHVGGLEAFGFYKFFVEKVRTNLYAAPTVLEELWPRRLSVAMQDLYSPDFSTRHRMRLEDYFHTYPLYDVTENEIGPFRLRLRRTRHHIPTYGFVLEHEGRTVLAYSADTTFDEDHIKFLSAATLIIHETGPGVHTDYEKLLTLPAELRARMRLIHYGDNFETDKSVIPCLNEGEWITI